MRDLEYFQVFKMAHGSGLIIIFIKEKKAYVIPTQLVLQEMVEMLSEEYSLSQETKGLLLECRQCIEIINDRSRNYLQVIDLNIDSERFFEALYKCATGDFEAIQSIDSIKKILEFDR